MRWVALAVLVVCTVAGATFSGDLANSATGPITVTATLATSTFRSVPPPGRRSDVSESSYRLNDRVGTRVGRLLLTCRWILSRSRFCAGEIKMPGGTIQVQGASVTSFLGEYAVTGGTGIYFGVKGAMRFTAVGERKSVLIVTITT